MVWECVGEHSLGTGSTLAVLRGSVMGVVLGAMQPGSVVGTDARQCSVSAPVVALC